MALKTPSIVAMNIPSCSYSSSHHLPSKFIIFSNNTFSNSRIPQLLTDRRRKQELKSSSSRRRRSNGVGVGVGVGVGGRMMISAALPPPLDLTEDNVRQVLLDARTQFAQIFDTSVGMTGVAELSEVDGPFVKISLRGRFWHERSMVLARLGNYLKQRIPEILEVDIEDVKQLDDSPENF